jgi:hypothetical protein
MSWQQKLYGRHNDLVELYAKTHFSIINRSFPFYVDFPFPLLLKRLDYKVTQRVPYKKPELFSLLEHLG